MGEPKTSRLDISTKKSFSFCQSDRQHYTDERDRKVMSTKAKESKNVTTPRKSKTSAKDDAVVETAASPQKTSSSSSSSSNATTPKTPKGGRGRSINAVTPSTTSGAAAAAGASGRSSKTPSPSRSKTPPKRRGFAAKKATSKTSEDIKVEGNNEEVSPQKLAPLVISPKVELAYKIVRKSTGALGGNGTTGAIYGELTIGSMQRVIDYLKENCELTEQSRFIDVGSGLGKPNFHAAQDPAARLSIGVELELIRTQLAMKNLSDVLKKCSDDPQENDQATELHSSVYFLHLDIDVATSLNPFTHIYMYDLGFPPDLQESIAEKFNTSTYAEWFISYRPPHRVINEYGYEVEFISQMMTSMHGSGEGHTVYFYKRALPLCPPRAGEVKVKLPKRAGIQEEEEEISCDVAFAEAAKLACGPVAALRANVDASVAQHLASERPKRERVPRVIDP